MLELLQEDLSVNAIVALTSLIVFAMFLVGRIIFYSFTRDKEKKIDFDKIVVPILFDMVTVAVVCIVFIASGYVFIWVSVFCWVVISVFLLISLKVSNFDEKCSWIKLISVSFLIIVVINLFLRTTLL
jgi:hypothetical protein